MEDPTYTSGPMAATRPATHAPQRSAEQRMEALRRANEIRVKRAELKRSLKEGSRRFEEIVSDPPEFVRTAKVFDMLMAVPKYGKVKANRFLVQCKISQSKTLGGLSDRQRQELVALLSG